MTGRAALALSSPRRDRPVLGSPPSPCPIAASLDGTPPAWAWRSSLRSVVRHAERGKLSDEMDDAQCVPAPQATVWAALNDPEPSCASAFRVASGAHDVGDRNGRLGRGPGRPGQGEVRPTLLHYVVDTRIGATLAQLGERLIDSTAKGRPASSSAATALTPESFLARLVAAVALGAGKSSTALVKTAPAALRRPMPAKRECTPTKTSA